MNKVQREKFIEEYQWFYFDHEKTKDNMKTKLNRSDLHGTKEIVEKHIEKKLRQENPKVDRQCVAWKAGRLLDITDEGDGINGYGNKITGLDEYLSNINACEKLKELINTNKEDTLEQIYEKLLNLQEENLEGHKVKEKVKNFGSVYMITMIYFLSGGKYPIYDRYAHIAVKALYFNITPRSVYVGAAESKDRVKEVMKMYNEYRWLLKQVFGTTCIDRSTDRALWVYGHSKSKNGFNNAEDMLVE